MKKIKYMVTAMLAGLNVAVVLGMIVCAYYSTLNNHENPDYSYIGMIFPFFLIASVAFLIPWMFLYKRYMLISGIGLLACIYPIRTFCPINFQKEIPDDAIKVLSYNVMNFNCPENWDESEIVKYINESNADIVCIQECGGLTQDVYNNYFRGTYPYRDSAYPNYAGLCMATFSKYPILATEKIDYISVGNASFVHTIDVDGDTLVVINNHLESYKLSEDDKQDYKTIIKEPKDDLNENRYDSLTQKLNKANNIRAAQADTIARLIEEKYKDGNVICCGDFNAPSLSYTHWILTRNLNDAYTRSGNGPGISYHRSGMFFRIDNILVSPNIEPFGAKVDNSIKESDHYPIFSYLKIGKK